MKPDGRFGSQAALVEVGWKWMEECGSGWKLRLHVGMNGCVCGWM